MAAAYARMSTGGSHELWWSSSPWGPELGARQATVHLIEHVPARICRETGEQLFSPDKVSGSRQSPGAIAAKPHPGNTGVRVPPKAPRDGWNPEVHTRRVESCAPLSSDVFLSTARRTRRWCRPLAERLRRTHGGRRSRESDTCFASSQTESRCIKSDAPLAGRVDSHLGAQATSRGSGSEGSNCQRLKEACWQVDVGTLDYRTARILTEVIISMGLRSACGFCWHWHIGNGVEGVVADAVDALEERDGG